LSAATIDMSRNTVVFAGATGQIPPSGGDQFLTGDFPAVVEASAVMADGQATRVRRIPGGMLFTFTVGAHSEAHRRMGLKWTAEKLLHSQKLAVPGEDMRAFDPTNGDVFSAKSVVISQPPGAQFSTEATRTWVLHGTDIDADYGLLIPVGGGSV
jgi:hypothetical protein